MSKKLILLLFFLLIITSMILGGSTYAFWHKRLANTGNFMHSGKLALEVNGTDGKTTSGRSLFINNLYPSNTVTDQIELINTGTMAIKYRINFSEEQDNNDLLYYTQVSFDDGITWSPLIYAEYLEINNPLPVNQTIIIPIQFRLDDTYSNWQSKTAKFKIVVTAVQYEDTLDSKTIKIEKPTQGLIEKIASINFQNFSPANHDEVIIRYSNDSKQVTINLPYDQNNEFGNWHSTNPFKITYDNTKKLLTVEVNGEKEDITMVDEIMLKSLQIKLLNHNNKGLVRLTNLTLNGTKLYGNYTSSISGNIWAISGYLFNNYNEFILEGNLELEGNHSSGDHSMVEISLGN